MQLKASAPGSLIILGEYAVLYDKQALIAAVNKRIFVCLTPNDSKMITVHSALSGQIEIQLEQLPDWKVEKSLEFVIAVLRYYHSQLTQGFHLEITAEFSDQVGLGSSAAVTVATLAVLNGWLNINMTSLELLHHARHIIRKVQGRGSGADVAASVYGGLVAYQATPLSVEKMSSLYPLTVLYTGYKTPTVSAIKRVEDSFAGHHQLFHQLINTIGECTLYGIQYVKQIRWQELGKIMNIQQSLMSALGVSNLLIQRMIEDLGKQPNIFGAKISGSGLGDCVIGLGEIEKNYLFMDEDHAAVKCIPLNMTSLGVICEKT